MTTTSLIVERVGHAVVQDLGRPGHASLGIAVGGALDQGAARTANTLVGNADSAALVEVTGSEIALRTTGDALLAVTGAADTVHVDGHAQPAWEALAVSAGSLVVVPVAASGYRSYVAVNGVLHADRVLGSVAPDPLLGVGTRLVDGDRLVVDSSYRHAPGPLGRVFRLGAVRPHLPGTATIRVTDGPDLTRVAGGRAALAGAFRVLPQSDAVGLRLLGAPIERTSTAEILSRGVPIGAVEVPPTGGIIILLRGRLVTAGYPVVAVVTTDSQDVLAQVRPGVAIELVFCDVRAARSALRARAAQRAALALRVRTALSAKGLADAVDPRHGATTTRMHT